MDWIDEAERETQARIERLRLITEHQEQIYESLWEEVKAQIEDAKRIERFRGLFTNGGQLLRLVKLPTDRGTREVAFALDKTSNRITARRTGGEFVVFDVDVCDDGVVCLKIGDKPVTLKDAAREALRPFLFIELYFRIPKPPIKFA